MSIGLSTTDRRQIHGDVARIAPSTRWAFLLLSLFAVFLSTSSTVAGDSHGNPYKVLGVPKRATLQTIRKAYKHLAKEWHPDKTDHPMAEDKFVEITNAHKLLTDPERRKKFDNYGITLEDISRQRDNNYLFHPFFIHCALDPLKDLFTGNFKFQYQNRDITLFCEMSITYRSFENVIVPKSYRMPYLILFFSEWSFMQAEPTWRRLIDVLEPLGLGLATVDVEEEFTLARRLGIHSVPCLVVTIDGHTSIYKESLFSIQKIVEFIRSRLPYKLIRTISDTNIDNFLSGWTDNRIRALIFEKRDFIRLRYLLMSFYYRDRVAFGFVRIGKPELEKITSKYKVSGELDTLLLFNENSEKPMASVSMKDISSETMHNVIANNKFLALPRLSNQAMLDSVCPPKWLRQQKRLCAVLISQRNSPLHDVARHKFRQAALKSSYSTERVRYAYVFKDSQAEFVSALSAGEGSPLEPLLHIVIIWRRDANHLKYEWLPHRWVKAVQGEPMWNETHRHLEKTIQKLLRVTEALPYAAVVGELTDEHAQGIIGKLIEMAIMPLSSVDYISDNLRKDQILILSVLLVTLLIKVAGSGMLYLVKLVEEEEARVQAIQRDIIKPIPSQPQLLLHELYAGTYNHFTQFLPPGFRSIILLVDAQSRLKLLPAFHKAVWPYRKNKTLTFAHMSLEKGLDWYKELLSLTLPERRKLNINAKNCVGTVLSLNSFRKYFCIYHAKHPEWVKGKGSKRMEKMTKQFSKKSKDPGADAFIDSDSSNESDLSQDEIYNNFYNKIYVDDLLDDLPMWLDRLFDGSTHRFYVNYWPKFTVK